MAVIASNSNLHTIHRTCCFSSISGTKHINLLSCSNWNSGVQRTNQGRLSICFSSRSLVPARVKRYFDPELRFVLELATESELVEVARILYSPSLFSPLLKSIQQGKIDDFVLGESHGERDSLIDLIESQFLYLAADAQSTLMGQRPSYRDVLLGLRKKLGVRCPYKLSTSDLEAEIFLHLLQESSSQEMSWENDNPSGSRAYGDRLLGVSNAVDVLKVGVKELQSLALRGGAMLTLAKLYQLVAGRLSGKLMLEAANYQLKREVIKKSGQLAVVSLESRVALIAARKGLASAASKYFGLRSMMALVGPLLWGTLLADVVIQVLGTDYARILRAVYTFAQIRLTRTYGWTRDSNQITTD